MTRPIDNSTIETTCCVVGGGPAGRMLGWLLARAGIRLRFVLRHFGFLRTRMARVGSGPEHIESPDRSRTARRLPRSARPYSEG